MLAVVAAILAALLAWVAYFERDTRRAHRQMMDEVNELLRERHKDAERRGK